jgi:hypothetical protein
VLSLHGRRWASTTTLLVGALLVGDSLHGTVVTGTYGVVSWAAIVRFVPGMVLIAIGYRLQVSVDEAEQYAEKSGREPATESERSFDPEVSPVGETLEEVSEADSDDDSGSKIR